MEDPIRTLGLPPDGDAHGYGPAGGQRWTQPWSSRLVAVLTALGGLAVGFLLVTGIVAGRSEAVVQDAREQALIDVIRDRQERVDALAAQLEELRARVAEAEAASAARAPALRAAVGRVEELAGLRALRGPGLRVELGDATGLCRGSQPQDCRIQDTDLQLVVNALFEAGAEGVAVGGERVIATTAIRSAGGAILVNYRVLAGPYVVEAVGDPEALPEAFAASDVAHDFEQWTETYGLSFAVTVADEVVLPGYGGALRVRHARPATDGTTLKGAGS